MQSNKYHAVYSDFFCMATTMQCKMPVKEGEGFDHSVDVFVSEIEDRGESAMHTVPALLQDCLPQHLRFDCR
jgi:hypothetical protein